MTSRRTLLAGVCAATTLALGRTGLAQTPAPAVPQNAADAIFKAFETYRLVGLNEGNHGNEQGAAFRLGLLRDPRFLAVDDVVVECGASQEQATIDRFMAGESVPDRELRKVWQDTTQAHAVWDTPIYEAFFRAAREVNARRPAGRKLRILLGDSPMDWSAVRPGTPAPLSRSDAFTADLIRKEVLAKGRRALVVYGGAHLYRRPPAPAGAAADRQTLPPIAPPPPGAGGAVPMRMMLPAAGQGSIVSLLEQGGEKMFVIWTVVDTDLAVLQPDVARWATPSLALIRGTPLGLAPLSTYSPPGQNVSFGVRPGGAMKTVQPVVRPGAMQEAVDAVLYLGPPSSITYSKLTRELCSDADYVQMRSSRIASRPSPTGGDSVGQFRAACAGALSSP